MGSLAHIEAISSLRSERSVKLETTWCSTFVTFLSIMMGLFCEERATREGMNLLFLRFIVISGMSKPKYEFFFYSKFFFFKENVTYNSVVFKLSGYKELYCIGVTPSLVKPGKERKET